MSRIPARVFRFALLTMVLGLCLTQLAAAEEIPINAWIHDPVISNATVSPDGNKLAALTLETANDPPSVTVWDTRKLDAPPKRFRPEDSKAIAVIWLNSERLFVVGRQAYDYRIGGKVTRWFRDRAYIFSDTGKDFGELLDDKDSIGVRIIDTLPNNKDKVLVAVTNLEFAEDIYELDLGSLRTKRVFRGASGESFFADFDGKIRGKSKIKAAGDDTRIEFSYRNPETNKWEMHHALYAGKREGMQPVAFDEDGRTVYMVDNMGRDKKIIRPYDLLTRKLGEPVFDDSTIEATAVMQSRQPEDFGKVIGYAGLGVGQYRQYTDEEWAGLQKKIDDALPAGRNNVISSISDDFSVAVVTSSGPKEPGAYYLLISGEQLVSLGRAFPFLEPDKLADMKYITYEARDGLQIPAYLTTPAVGEPPYPAVVLPHGGPWARDLLGWDLFAQFLANRGYVVLQPQYRGSEGLGQKLWRAGDREWGGKMSDDNDDGAAWLVQNGLTKKDRIAIFGYSYGGYAAMVAIVRPNPPYQCAISGAGLSNLRYFDKVTFENPYGREFQNPTIRGTSPIDQVRDASIPIYIFHGDRDQRVPIEQSQSYVRALEGADKVVEYQEIVDLWHSFPWFPQHRYAVLTSIEDYLKNRCGPGGL
ncbi:MAG TPA: prolyl oligopeptidase family serine peptidase [Woeseiaceae bacterium]|nr:prolyl oligopeptidase family serine peptidase [Woeseiaceae bacterium]